MAQTAAVDAQAYTEELSRVRRHDLWGLRDLDAFGNEAFDLRVAHRMLHDDATIAAAWGIIRLTLGKVLGEYQHDDPTIQEFVRQALTGAEGYERALQALATAPLYGYSCVETIWRPAEAGEYGASTPRWVYRKFKPVHPLTIRDGFRTDERGDLTEIEQRVLGYSAVVLPRPKLVLWSYNDTWGDRPQGYSLLEPVYSHYHACRALQRLWHRALEQGPRPLITWPVPPGDMYCPTHGRMEPRVQVITEVLDDIDDRSGIVYVAQGEDWANLRPEVLANAHINPADFLAALRYHEGAIYKALLTPRMLLEEPEHATRAQAQVQYYGPFVQHVEGLAAELGKVLVDQLVRPLLAVNFGEVADFGSWEVTPLRPEEYDMWAGVILRLVNSGLMLTPEDWAKIRSYYGDLLLPGEEAAETALPEAAEAKRAAEGLTMLGRYEAELQS